MKILNPQSATLSNYEVYAHLMSKREASLHPTSNSTIPAATSKKASQSRDRERERPQQRKLKAPNYEAVSREILEYLSPGSSTLAPTVTTTSKDGVDPTVTLGASKTSPDAISTNPASKPSNNTQPTTQEIPAPAPAAAPSLQPPERTFPLPPYASQGHFSNQRVASLLQDLAPYDLAKAELLMIVNLRPGDAASLDAIVEEADYRFDEAKQAEILAVIARWIGVR